MLLLDLLRRFDSQLAESIARNSALAQLAISGIREDSRQITAGDVFIAKTLGMRDKKSNQRPSQQPAACHRPKAPVRLNSARAFMTGGFSGLTVCNASSTITRSENNGW